MAGKHVEKQSHKSGAIDSKGIRIRLSPESLACFRELERIVRDSPHFDPDARDNLRDFMAGEPVTIRSALMNVMAITDCIHEYQKATGDRNAYDALDPFRDLLYEAGEQAFSIVNVRERTR